MARALPRWLESAEAFSAIAAFGILPFLVTRCAHEFSWCATVFPIPTLVGRPGRRTAAWRAGRGRPGGGVRRGQRRARIPARAERRRPCRGVPERRPDAGRGGRRARQ